MMRVLAVYSQQQRDGTGQDSTTLCDQLHQEWYGWVGAAKQHSRDTGANTAWIKQGELVKRTPFTTFNGSQEGWAEFKRVFQEVISTNGHAKALELA